LLKNEKSAGKGKSRASTRASSDCQGLVKARCDSALPKKGVKAQGAAGCARRAYAPPFMAE